MDSLYKAIYHDFLIKLAQLYVTDEGFKASSSPDPKKHWDHVLLPATWTADAFLIKWWDI
jgi:hypothetical protein